MPCTVTKGFNEEKDSLMLYRTGDKKKKKKAASAVDVPGCRDIQTV